LASSREPIFNVPAVLVATLGVLLLVHAGRSLLLSPREDLQFLVTFAFIPARYDGMFQGLLPGSVGSAIWSFATYALIHGDWTHIALNAVWLLAFGSPVARRFGAIRFVAFLIVTAIAGAGLHLATHWGEFAPMVGASASISGCMAAAMRFIFGRGGGIGMLRPGHASFHWVPAAPLSVTLRDPRVLAFLGVWVGVNLLFGLGGFTLGEEGQSVAWQAHVGGFLAGLLLFPLFDPVPSFAHFDDEPDPRRDRAPR
jgi:membrane associated rhomboid family serine protease